MSHVFALMAGGGVQPRSLDGRLSLSDDTALEVLLADIPFFSIGLVAFAVSTFFLVMRRVTLLSVYLYASALFSFGAAILDLSQMLARGVENTENNTGLDAVTGLINTREVGFALSVGFRFLFFWAFVAERPRGEPVAELAEGSRFNPREDSHSASWQRWGYLGFILKWALLAIIIAITTLQIIWRIAARRYDVIYVTETTMEIVVSGLFILKILLNIFLSPVRPWWRPSLTSFVPLVTMALNLGVGVGNLVFFAFSETTLGRFLQAVEVYTLLLYILIAEFYHSPDRRSRVGPARNRSSSFMGLGGPSAIARGNDASPEKGPDIASTGYVQTRIGAPDVANYRRPNIPTRPARISRESSSLIPWLSSRNAPPSSPGPRQNNSMSPRKQDIEAGLSDKRGSVSEPSQPKSPNVNIPDEKISPVAASQPSGLLQTSEAAPSASDPNERTVIRPITATTNFSVPSYYGGGDRRSRASSVLEPPNLRDLYRSRQGSGSDSPIYGLNGIIRRGLANPPRASLNSVESRQNNSLSSFDELLRQQSELDKSIAALRLFSPRTSVASVPQSEQLTPRPPSTMPPIATDTLDIPRSFLSDQADTSRSSSGQRIESSSNRSEFSLSVFPDPPNDSMVVTPKTASMIHQQSRVSRTDVPLPPPSRRFTYEVPSIPSSPTKENVSNPRFDSAGTQYDVTSFIGDLSIPGIGHRPSGSGGGSNLFNRFGTGLSDVESGDESSPTILTAERTVQNVRPIVLDTQTTAATAPLPWDDEAADEVSPLSPGSAARRNSPQLVLRPFLLGNVTTSTPIVSSPLATSAPPRNTDPARRAQPIRNRRLSQVNISRPMARSSDTQSPGAFERPRPPPLIVSGSGTTPPQLVGPKPQYPSAM